MSKQRREPESWNDDDEDFENDVDDETDEDGDDTIPCPNCREPVFDDAEQCPHCGEYLTGETARQGPKPTWIIVTVVVLLIALAVASF